MNCMYVLTTEQKLRTFLTNNEGTTGCVCLMHYGGLDATTAILTAKKCRRVIDPIGRLPMFLTRLERAEKASK
jgi:hypothetical protein